MIIFVFVILILMLLAVLAVNGRTGQQGIADLLGWSYAHRGLHGSGAPENSMEAFRRALDGGYGIELDVHQMADGGLAVIHDSSLKRTAGADVTIESLTTKQMKKYRLEGTSQQIPEFCEVLELFQGKAPMIIELKSQMNNYASLCQTVCDALEGYEGPYCIESFDPRCLLWLKKNRPEIIRGQLSMNYFKGKNKMPFILKVLLSFNIANAFTKPDFIAYHVEDRDTLTNRLTRGLWGVLGVSWTIRSKEEYDRVVKEGWLPIFENFKP